MLRISFLIILFISSQLSATEVYRSIDKNGRTVYSEDPPQGKEHELIDIEIKNKLGAKIDPSPKSQHYRPFVPSNPIKSSPRLHTGNSSSKKTEKLDMKTLQEKCESYRNASTRTNFTREQRKKRDYWCSRLHRGK
ncbi:MAG: DUF4124 domain-containing protein [Sulfuriflexus sp.]|nr:DUF4124 domain-containing protein [Sulfuriflexus sp.]